MIKNNQAFSLIELLVVIGIMVILTSVTIASIHFNRHQKVRQLSEMVASDIRLVRNMVISRVVNPTLGTYPAGGYGIQFDSGVYCNSPNNKVPSSYIIFAENGAIPDYQAGQDVIVKAVTFDELRYRIIDQNKTECETWKFYFTLRDEHTSSGNITRGAGIKYLIMVADPYPGQPYNPGQAYPPGAHGYAGTIIIGELDEQGFTWSNLDTVYGNYRAPSNKPGGGGWDPLGDPGAGG